VLRGKNGPALPFERSHGSVVVDRDDEDVGLVCRRFEIPHVTDVQEIEDAIGEGDRSTRLARLAHARDQRFAREHLTHETSLPWRCLCRSFLSFEC
jgi:hypothetical protein